MKSLLTRGKVFAAFLLFVFVASGETYGEGKGGKGKKGNSSPAKASTIKAAKAYTKKAVPRVRKILKQTDSKLKSRYINFPYNQTSLQGGDDKTLSPYFYVAGGDAEEDRLPLKETSAHAQIAGVIANVEIRQVFGNDGKEPIEAVYVFPASTRAAVHGMKMKIGDRTIEAKIDKREEAKEKYTKAKTEGKHASLLQQERPNVFTMRVANIMPKDTIEVLIQYSELLVHEKGVYEFVYPSVVGPRYGGDADPLKDMWIENPYQHAGEKELYKFDMKVDLETGMALKDVKSPSHKIDVNYHTKSSATVKLDESGGGNRDFILKYRLAGEKIDSEVLLYEHTDENFFVLMVQPPKKVQASKVLPREYIFVLDVSGSMGGFPLQTAKTLMKDLLKNLRPDDYFNIVTFAGGSMVLSSKSLPVTNANLGLAEKKLASTYGSGGTELMQGLKKAYGITKIQNKKISRSIVVITDGYVGVEDKAFKFIREHLSDANLFAFGIGSSVNRHLIEGMARAGFGEPFVVDAASHAAEQADKFRQYVQRPLLTNIKVKFDGFGAFDQAPGRIPDLMAERPLVVFGKYKGKPEGSIKVTGMAADGKFEKKLKVTSGGVKKKNRPIRYLWVRKWVELLGDQLCMLPENGDLKKTITKLGLHYSLLTPFTSFVAVDTKKVNKEGKVKTVKQPLPLPAGVSNLAVGNTSTYGMVGGIGYGKGGGGGSSYGFGGIGIKGTGSGGGGVSYPMMINPMMMKSKSASGSVVTGSMDTSSIKKTIKKAVAGNKDVKALKTQCPCAEMKLKISVELKEDGSLKSLKVEKVDFDESCKCAKGLLKSIEKSLKKAFKTKKFENAGSIHITFPLVIKK